MRSLDSAVMTSTQKYDISELKQNAVAEGKQKGSCRQTHL